MQTPSTSDVMQYVKKEKVPKLLRKPNTNDQAKYLIIVTATR